MEGEEILTKQNKYEFRGGEALIIFYLIRGFDDKKKQKKNVNIAAEMVFCLFFFAFKCS